MKRWLIVLMIFLIVPIVYGICCERSEKCIISEICQDAACGNCSITVYNRSGIIQVPQSNMEMISYYTYIFNISKDVLDYGTYPYAINCTDNAICQGECQVEVMQECEGENAEYIFYIITFIIFFTLLGIGYYKVDGVFVMISGMLAMIIGINLFINGFPHLSNTFLKNSIVVVIWGIGAYLTLAPAIEFFEGWK